MAGSGYRVKRLWGTSEKRSIYTYRNYIMAVNQKIYQSNFDEAARAVSSNMVLRGCFLYGIRICRFTASQIKAEYH